MTPREQVRRDAEQYAKGAWMEPMPAPVKLARHCLALLAELEQAERERDEAKRVLAISDEEILVAHLEARLAKVQQERDEFEQACATAGQIIADLKAKLGVQAAVASVADDALLSRRRL